MTDEPSAPPVLRASDADRERTATTLREHTAAGRLTPEELSDRLDAAYAARTVAELDALLHDLPPATPAAAAAPTRSPARARVLHAVGLVVLVNVACVAIWLASGDERSFWPKWVLLASAIRLAFVAWGELGPAGSRTREEEARLGRGGAARRARRPLDRR